MIPPKIWNVKKMRKEKIIAFSCESAIIEKRYIKVASLVPKPENDIGINVIILEIAIKKVTVTKFIGNSIAIINKYACRTNRK